MTYIIEHEKMPYHLPILPFVLLKHQIILQKKELQPQVEFDDNGNALVSQLPQEVIDSIVCGSTTVERKMVLAMAN